MIEILNLFEGYKLVKPILDMGESTVYMYPDYFKYYMMSQNFRIIGLRPEIPRLSYVYRMLLLRKKSEIICGFPFKYNKKTKEISFIFDQKSINNFIYE